jgi:hypothetical protein
MKGWWGGASRNRYLGVCYSTSITPFYAQGQAIHVDALAERDYGRTQQLIAAG